LRRSALGSLQSAVDAGKNAGQPNAAAQERLDQTKADLGKTEDRLARIAEEMAAKSPDAEAIAREGFLRDLITDDDGPSLHRVQMVGWPALRHPPHAADAAR
jgi:hypothetical protein